MSKSLHTLAWFLIFVIAIILLVTIALYRGETINAIWLIVASMLTMLIGYRFYSRYIAEKVFALNPRTKTPAITHNDGLDYVPTNRYVLFGHHFAAIAGAGPLVGPVLAAQMGYLPGLLWILVGVTLAGAVQDFIILIISMRNDARSLGELIKLHLGRITGIIAMISIYMIMIILIGVLALVVLKALAYSPWSLFAVAATIPIGIFMGIYMRFIQPGKVGQASLIGFVLLIAAIIAGKYVANSPMAASFFTYDAKAIVWMLTGYGFFASLLPVWLLLAPRDYLSTFLKVGTILLLAIVILCVAPQIKLPAVTQFIDGSGPVWSGSLFPFLFITIACGAVSGFHALVASGTTPKMIANELDARLVGYGAMLMEGFVAVVALIVASCLEPGVYFALNTPPSIIGTTLESASQTISQWGFVLTPEMLTETAKHIGETTILSRTGGAPTLAIGIAQMLTQLFTDHIMLAFWYHFAILFEALFILTAVDAGTRVGRFMLQDLLGSFIPAIKDTRSWFGNFIASFVCVSSWGYFLYQGVVDPLGGINTLWPLFGIANQMLACMALIFATVMLVKTNRIKYIWVTLMPTIWLLICTLDAGMQKIFSLDAKIGFLAHAKAYKDALAIGKLLPPSQSIPQMQEVITNDYINATLAAGFSAVLIYIAFCGIFAIWLVFAGKEICLKKLIDS